MSDLVPPQAKIIPVVLTHHDDARTDNYHWMRDRSDPDVIAYLQAENNYTQSIMNPLENLQKTLYAEMLSHIEEDDTEVPFPRGSFLYYKRTEKGKAYPIHCRKTGPDGAEQVLLNENQLAAGHKFFSLGNFKISANENLLAYSTDVEGDEVYVTRIRNLKTGQDLDDQIPETYYSLEWTGDNSAFYYVTLNEAKRPYRVWRHQLGQQENELIFEEEDERFEVDVSQSRDRRWIFIRSESKITSEIRFAPAAEPSAFQVVWPRRQDVLYDVEAHGDDFYISTNDGAREFRLLRCSAQNPDRQSATEILPQRAGITLEAVYAFQNFLAIYERDHGLPKIRIHDLRDDQAHYVTFTEPAFTLGTAPNEVFDTNLLRFTYTSLVTPVSVFEYNVQSQQQALLKQTPVPGYDPAQYTTERVFAPTGDGLRVPISLVYHSDARTNEPMPLLLYGYGSYGLRSDPAFRSERLSLLDRGVAFALAHIRGGSDLGRQWYDDGKLLKKQNTFDDFIRCAEYLIENRYTEPSRLAIQGGSAGGLLMGAVLNKRPDLFQCVVANVPFVDTLTTCLDPTLPLTVGEYEEWGNASQPEFYRYIKSYSPYDNVKPTRYPPILVTAGLNDPRVSYWEPAKWTAKLRAVKLDENLLLLKTNMDAGHFGASGRYARLKELSFIYAFILKSLGVSFAHES